MNLTYFGVFCCFILLVFSRGGKLYAAELGGGSGSSGSSGSVAGGGKGLQPIQDVINDLSAGKANSNSGGVSEALKNQVAGCISKILDARDTQYKGTTPEQVLSLCRMANMSGCRPKSTVINGVENSCHHSCSAIDIGRIECGTGPSAFKFVPSDEADGNEYFLILAKCINGDESGIGGGGRSVASGSNSGKGKKVGVCYYDPCSTGENAIGPCDTSTHTNHIHLSDADACGKHEHKEAFSKGGACKGSKNNLKTAGR